MKFWQSRKNRKFFTEPLVFLASSSIIYADTKILRNQKCRFFRNNQITIQTRQSEMMSRCSSVVVSLSKNFRFL
nr:MAG TPA: hypothetical protein [Caudoviricetes sp.]